MTAGHNEDRGFVIGFMVGFIAAVGVFRAFDRPVVGGLILLTAAALGWGWQLGLRGTDR